MGKFHSNTMTELYKITRKNATDLPEIPDERLRLFKAVHLPAYSPPLYRKFLKPKSKWHKHPYPPSESILRGHLAGKFSLGYPCRTFTKWVCVDIDRHRDEPEVEIWATGARVLLAFPEADPVIVQSSHSGGLHLFYYLPESTWSISARGFATDRLKDAGLEGLEVYPMGSKNFRIPFGPGSVLLDKEFIQDHSTSVASFLAFLWRIENGKIEPLEIPSDYRGTLTPNKDSTTHHKPLRSQLGASTALYMVDLDLLLSEGLQPRENLRCLRPDEPYGRNKQTWLLVWYFKVIEGLSDEDTVARINGWIDWGHNGLSKDYTADPAKVYAENARIVKHFDPDKVNTTPSERPKGRTIDRKGYRDIERRLNKLAIPAPERAVFEAILKHCYRWCDLSEEWTMAEIPIVYLKKAKGDYNQYLDRLIQRGLVAIIAPHSKAKEQCRTYRIRVR